MFVCTERQFFQPRFCYPKARTNTLAVIKDKLNLSVYPFQLRATNLKNIYLKLWPYRHHFETALLLFVQAIKQPVFIAYAKSRGHESKYMRRVQTVSNEVAMA